MFVTTYLHFYLFTQSCYFWLQNIFCCGTLLCCFGFDGFVAALVRNPFARVLLLVLTHFIGVCVLHVQFPARWSWLCLSKPYIKRWHAQLPPLRTHARRTRKTNLHPSKTRREYPKIDRLLRPESNRIRNDLATRKYSVVKCPRFRTKSTIVKFLSGVVVL